MRYLFPFIFAPCNFGPSRNLFLLVNLIPNTKYLFSLSPLSFRYHCHMNIKLYVIRSINYFAQKMLKYKKSSSLHSMYFYSRSPSHYKKYIFCRAYHYKVYTYVFYFCEINITLNSFHKYYQ